MTGEKRPKFLFFRGAVVPYDEARLHVLSTAVKYSAVVYEGLRAYWDDRNRDLYGFRLYDHWHRLLRSMKTTQIIGPQDINYYQANLLHLIRANELREDLHMRVQVFVEEDNGGIGSTSPVSVAMAAIPTGRMHPMRGVSAQVSSWTRISDRSMPPRIKTSANYHNSRLAVLQARADGYDEAILLTENGAVAEGPGYTVLMVRNGRLLVPRVTDSVLEGVTRDTIIKLASQVLHIEVEERRIDRTELYDVDEVFFCGSGAEVVPVLSVDRRPVGAGTAGPITLRLRDTYLAYARGEVDDTLGWLSSIYAANAASLPGPR